MKQIESEMPPATKTERNRVSSSGTDDRAGATFTRMREYAATTDPKNLHTHGQHRTGAESWVQRASQWPPAGGGRLEGVRWGRDGGSGLRGTDC